jgi:cytidyltransferase-like protein
MTIVYVDMVGDLFHYNHVNLIRESLKYGDEVYVGVHNDKDVASYKCIPILTMEERIGVIEACKYVSKVISNAPIYITKEFIDKHNIDLIIHAHDENEHGKYASMYKEAIKLNKFKRMDYQTGISSTNIKQRVIDAYLNPTS